MPVNSRFVEIFPYTHRLVHFLARSRRYFLWSAFAIILLTLIAWVAALGWNLRQRTKAEQVFRNLGDLAVDQSTMEDVQAWISRQAGDSGIREEKEGTPDEQTAFGVSFLSPTHNKYGYNRVFLRSLGLRPWYAGASVRVRKGRVWRKTFSVYMRTAEGFWLGSSSVAVPNLDPPNHPSLHIERGVYAVGWFHMHVEGGGDGLSARVGLNAKPEAMRRTWDINFDCLTSMKGCTDLCELVPGMWLDNQMHLQKLYPDEEWEEISPRCLKATAKYEPLRAGSTPARLDNE